MASVLHFFMSPDDERLFFRDLSSLRLELYPEVVPPDWRAPTVDESLIDDLEDSAYYLAAPELGPVQVDKVKRGPNKGKWMVLEVISPVIHYERSMVDPDEGVLRAGRIWAELQVSGDTQKRVQKAPQFERLFKQLSDVITRRARRSKPVGHWILPGAVKLHGEGVELRESGRKGGIVTPYR